MNILNKLLDRSEKISTILLGRNVWLIGSPEKKKLRQNVGKIFNSLFKVWP
ncbi:MAG: hypothetical protein AAB019_02465 [Planctomycetota bacterium]